MFSGNRKNQEEFNVRRLLGTAALLFIFTLIPLLYPMAADANAPKSVQLVYDLSSQTLSVTILHSSPSPTFHYINRVVVKKTGKVLETAEYKSQPDKPEFTYTYKIAATAGDTLEITVSCNIFGSKTEKITIPKASN
jgi:hypothetical protein